jgi:hypothetical protein
MIGFVGTKDIRVETFKRPNILCFWLMIWDGRIHQFFSGQHTPFNERYHTPSMGRLTGEMVVKPGHYLRGVKAQRLSFKSTGRDVPWPDESF